MQQRVKTPVVRPKRAHKKSFSFYLLSLPLLISAMFNRRIKIKELLNLEPNNQQVTVMGWVRTFRNNQFIALNDGSTNTSLQVVIELGLLDEATLKRITTGASVKIS